MSWLKPKPAAKYCGIGERTLRKLLKEGLRHSRLPSGTILIKAAWIDEFFERFEVGSQADEVNQIVDSTLREMDL